MLYRAFFYSQDFQNAACDRLSRNQQNRTQQGLRLKGATAVALSEVGFFFTIW